MVDIELGIDNNMANIDLTENSENNNFLKELEFVTDYMQINSSQNDEVISNYYNQASYLTIAIREEMIKAEDELFEKWNLEDGIYANYEDYGDYENSSIIPIITENLTNKFNNANDMSEINNEEVLNNCKEKITQYYISELDEYAKKYNLDNTTLMNIKNDIPNLVNKHFYKITDELLNNNFRDKLEELCDELEESYKNKNYTKMKSISDQISKELSGKKAVYRDETLFNRLRVNITKSKIVQNKLEKGQDGSLSKSEEDIILKYDSEQMKNLKREDKENFGLSESDISILKFETNTNIIKEILENTTSQVNR